MFYVHWIAMHELLSLLAGFFFCALLCCAASVYVCVPFFCTLYLLFFLCSIFIVCCCVCFSFSSSSSTTTTSDTSFTPFAFLFHPMLVCAGENVNAILLLLLPHIKAPIETHARKRCEFHNYYDVDREIYCPCVRALRIQTQTWTIKTKKQQKQRNKNKWNTSERTNSMQYFRQHKNIAIAFTRFNKIYYIQKHSTRIHTTNTYLCNKIDMTHAPIVHTFSQLFLARSYLQLDCFGTVSFCCYHFDCLSSHSISYLPSNRHTYRKGASERKKCTHIYHF